ncbi:MAG: hypothetical protein ACRC33_20470, partial [Gemmataceae bacterium]
LGVRDAARQQIRHPRRGRRRARQEGGQGGVAPGVERRPVGDAAPESIEAELIDLGLLPYCQPALDRRARSTSPNSF